MYNKWHLTYICDSASGQLQFGEVMAYVEVVQWLLPSLPAARSHEDSDDSDSEEEMDVQSVSCSLTLI